MSHSICGLDCSKCELKDTCKGCAETNGRPFGSECVVAMCCKEKDSGDCGRCPSQPCTLRKQLVAEFNGLGIPDMEEIKVLHALKGSFINLEYALPGGQTVKFLDDEKIYLGTQASKQGSTRCYGLAADEQHLLVCEYGEKGTNAEVVLYKRRKA